MLKMKPLSFEKDDDSNGHIDFITATSVRNKTNFVHLVHLSFVIDLYCRTSVLKCIV